MRYVPGAGMDSHVAMVDLNAADPQKKRHYFHRDRLGNVIASVRQDGELADQYLYSPFGLEHRPVDPSGNPLRYTGQRYDGETGFYYYKARYYEPSLRRFLQTDPLLFADQMNLYAYVGNDPLGSTDPTGEFLAPDHIVDERLEQFRGYAQGPVANTVREKGIGLVFEADTNLTVGSYSRSAKVFVAASIGGDHGSDIAGGAALGTSPPDTDSGFGLGGGASFDPGILIGDASDLRGQSGEISLDGLVFNEAAKKLPSSIRGAAPLVKNLKQAQALGVDVTVPFEDGGATTVQVTFGPQIGVAAEGQTVFLCSRADGCK